MIILGIEIDIKSFIAKYWNIKWKKAFSATNKV